MGEISSTDATKLVQAAASTYWSSRAQARLGVSRVQTAVDPMINGLLGVNGMSTGAGGTGANIGTAATAGGVWRITCGTDVGGIAFLYSSYIFSGTVTSKWHLFCRAKLVTAVQTGTKATLLGIADGSSRELSFGVYGSGVTGGSATKFVACYDGAAGPAAAQIGISTVSIDAAWHEFEMWSNGSAVYISVDNETAVLTTAANTAAQRNLYIGVTHTGGGADTFDLDWWSLSMPEAA